MAHSNCSFDLTVDYFKVNSVTLQDTEMTNWEICMHSILRVYLISVAYLQAFCASVWGGQIIMIALSEAMPDNNPRGPLNWNVVVMVVVL